MIKKHSKHFIILELCNLFSRKKINNEKENVHSAFQVKLSTFISCYFDKVLKNYRGRGVAVEVHIRVLIIQISIRSVRIIDLLIDR